MSNTRKLSASPHIRSELSTGSIMLDVIIALLPASIFGVYNFGFKAFLIIMITIASSVAFEWLYDKLLKRKSNVGDFSAVVTGLLLALNLSADVQLWMPILGSAFAIIVVKQLFGGIGQNFMNPALAARCFLLLSFTGPMTTFTYDSVTGATPLAIIKGGEQVDLFKMFIGSTAGTIGETSTAALLIGFIYLLARKIISPRIPLAYIGSFGLMIYVYALAVDMTDPVYFLLAELCGGGLMLGAIFMATDYVTSPITPKGKIVFGVLLGTLTFCFRMFGASAEGVSYAIIIGNLFVPLIEKFTIPKSFGKEDVNKTKKEKNSENKTLAKDASSLFLITAIAGLMLGGVYMITEGPIASQKQKQKEAAYKEVFTDAETFENFDSDNAEEILASAGISENAVTINEVMVAKKDSDILGYVMKVTTHEGYAGDIEIACGIRVDGTVNGISFLSIGETAGLGMKAKDEAFKGEFSNQQVDSFVVTKTKSNTPGEVDAITGATITTNAVTNAVNGCLVYFQSLEGGAANE